MTDEEPPFVLFGPSQHYINGYVMPDGRTIANPDEVLAKRGRLGAPVRYGLRPFVRLEDGIPTSERAAP